MDGGVPGGVDEVEQIKRRYDRRDRTSWAALYDPLSPSVYLAAQERERALIRLIERAGLAPVRDRRVLEVGCGAGENLLELIRLGFRPENLMGNELSAERAQLARHRLPAATAVLEGDAAGLDLPPASFDVVFQSMVLSSMLDDSYQRRLAGRMWSLAKPGGGILWYDFTYNNPANADVRGIPIRRIRQLFPDGDLTAWRLTLAPPLSRTVTRIHPTFYTALNVLPFLRTHVLCWIRKAA